MRKFLILLVIIGIAGASFAADLKLKDVKDDHWAATAVYDLVRMGVTKGYPDGTFRGTKPITRYETAIFLAKLAEAIGADDLKADIKALKDDVAAMKGPGGSGAVSGSYQGTWQFGNILAEGTRGGVASYRLKLSTSRDLGNDANVAVNLDTMSYGFFDDGSTTTGDVLATKLFDIESNFKLNLAEFGLANPLALKVTYGPGAQQYTTDATGGVLPSAVGLTYSRPDTGIEAATSLFGLDVVGGYSAVAISSTGRIQTSKIAGSLGYGFADLPLINKLDMVAKGSYISSGIYSSTNRDMRGEIAFTAPIGNKVSASGVIGLGGSGSSTMMVAGDVKIDDIWETGTVAKINVAKVGSEFINSNFASEEFDYAGLDNFSRPLTNGTVNLGGEVVQNVSNDVKLIGKGDLRLGSDYSYNSTSGRLTAEGGISYNVAPNATLDALYRLHQDKGTGDTSDVAALGLMYNF
ncbi:MAG: S-layer homology domain-containing protein [bacterium]